MLKWNLTTKSPEVSGEYMVIKRWVTPSGYKYSAPEALMYSKKHDAWNACDHSPANHRLKDLRDEPAELFASRIFAWIEIEPLTADEIAELEKGVA